MEIYYNIYSTTPIWDIRYYYAFILVVGFVVVVVVLVSLDISVVGQVGVAVAGLCTSSSGVK
jgi:hypothetical protein